MAEETATVLIADDDDDLRATIRTLLEEREDTHYEIREARSGQEVLRIAAQGLDLILLDFEFPDADGLQILSELKDNNYNIPVIMMSGHATSSHIIMKTSALRAEKYLIKPIKDNELFLQTIEKVLHDHYRPSSDIYELPFVDPDDKLIGVSQNMIDLFTLIPQLAVSNDCLYLRGETGTGKTYIAEMIHKFSARKKFPFKVATCSNIVESIADSLLFGSVKGAFTGSVNSMGWFEAANHSTLFLDEIAELPISTQVKLFKAVEEHKITRVGENTPVPINVRLIVATNRDLEQMVQMGTFREELYHRISIVHATVPPLRERKEDIPKLVAYFLQQKPHEIEGPLQITKSAMQKLIDYHWPGNVRQLKNTLIGVIAKLRGNIIAEDMIDIKDVAFSTDLKISEMVYQRMPYEEIVKSAKKQILQTALNQSLGNIDDAALSLKLSRQEFITACYDVGLPLM